MRLVIEVEDEDGWGEVEVEVETKGRGEGMICRADRKYGGSMRGTRISGVQEGSSGKANGR